MREVWRPVRRISGAGYVGCRSTNDYVYNIEKDARRDRLNTIKPNVELCNGDPEASGQGEGASGDGERVLQRIPVNLSVFHNHVIPGDVKAGHIGSVPNKYGAPLPVP